MGGVECFIYTRSGRDSDQLSVGASLILGAQKCRTTLAIAMIYFEEWGFDQGDRKCKNLKILEDGATFTCL